MFLLTYSLSQRPTFQNFKELFPDPHSTVNQIRDMIQLPHMNNSVVGLTIKQNYYQGFPSRSCGLLFPFPTPGCSHKNLKSLSSCSPASCDAHQDNGVSRTHTDWHQVAADKQPAPAATMWLCRLRLRPSDTQQAGCCVSARILKRWRILPLISLFTVKSGEGGGCKVDHRTDYAVFNHFLWLNRQNNRPCLCLLDRITEIYLIYFSEPTSVEKMADRLLAL